VKDSVYQILSYLAITANFLPLILVKVRRLWNQKAFLLFALYWAVSGVINVLDLIPGISKSQTELITVVYNMLDIPIVLAIIHYTTASFRIRKFTKVAAPSFLLLQLINFSVKGWHYDAAKYVLAIGLLLVLSVIVWEIYLYMSKLEHSNYEKAIIFIHVSLLFAYGTFVIIYIFDYVITIGNSSIGNFIVYYISTLIALAIASIGYLSAGASRKLA
jgi:hypothetical protein